MDSLSLSSLNVRGLGNSSKRLQLFTWLKGLNNQIYFLQETHYSNSFSKLWEQNWDGKCFFSGEKSNSEGVAILVHPNSKIELINKTEIVIGRLIAVEIKINEKNLILVNIYGPNQDDDTLFINLENFLLQNSDKECIVGGDFNTILNKTLDKKNGNKNNHSKCRKRILKLMQTCNLVDIWRIKFPQKTQFTWHSNSQPTVHCRLDYFLTSDSLTSSVHNASIKTSYKTDHSLIQLDIQTSKNNKGNGYFKLNNSLLTDEQYLKVIKDTIKLTAEINNDCSPDTLWEVMKGNIRNETIKYATFKHKNEKEEEKKLLQDIKNLENELENPNADIEKITSTMAEKKQLLCYIYDNKINGQILRSKAIHVEQNEKNSTYFANLEKHKSEKKAIHKLVVNGKTLTDKNEILNAEVNFYSKIYNATKINENLANDFLNKPINILSDGEKQTCEGCLTEYECKLALNQMKNNKSPGSDGLSVEFYKTFWRDISQFLLNSLNHSFEIGNLTQLQRQGIITLIPKPNKDLDQISNWRPITLLNIDYKIATKSIANRINKILPSIISSDQTGFMQNRYIGENVRTIFEIIEYAQNHHIPGLIFFADFEKAFDSLSHTFIVKCFQKFNFGTDLIKWIKLFYTNISSIIINNGHLSPSFDIKRGVRQGCPLSTSNFNICLEILSNNIKLNESIKGIKAKNHEIKQTYFADDGTFTIDGSKQSFESLIESLEKFSMVSGLNLNTSKSIVLRIGSLKNSQIKFCDRKNFIWSSEQANTLGMIFTNNSKNNLHLNTEKKIDEFANCLKQWQHRKLTLMGKITVIKTFALPKLIYPFTVLANPPQKIINHIQSLIFQFLYDGKPDKIKRQQLYQTYENGGLKLTDIVSFINAIKCGWVKRYQNCQNNGKWKIFFDTYLCKFGKLLLFESNLNIDTCKITDSDFINDVIKAWFTVQSKFEKSKPTEKQASKIIIWNNSDIKTNAETLFFETWYEKGIYLLEHLFDFRTKSYYSFEQMKFLYSIPDKDFLRYLTLLNSIPERMKSKLKTEQITYCQDKETLLQIIAKKRKPNRFMYCLQLDNFKPLKSETKWENILNNSNINWKKIYIIPFLSITDISLRYFQYKILHRIIPTNKYLYYCKLSNSNLCEFCSSHIETIEHVFYECYYVQIFWNHLILFLENKNIDLKVQKQDILLGIAETKQFQKQLNFILISAKHYIYKMRCTQMLPKLCLFKYHLTKNLNLEREIALKNDNLELFRKNWDPFFDL